MKKKTTKKTESKKPLFGQIFDPDKMTRRQIVAHEARVFKDLSTIDSTIAKKWAAKAAQEIAHQEAQETEKQRADELLKQITKGKPRR